MSRIPPAVRRRLRDELFRLIDESRALTRRIIGEIDPDVDTRDEIRVLSAKGEVFWNAVDDLIHFDPTERSSSDAELKALRRQTDELIVRRAELDRSMRDTRRRALEAEEEVRVARANRLAEETNVEAQRVGEVT